LVLQSTGYVANSATQPARAIAGIRFISGPVPAITICLGILFTLLYPLGREKHHEITRELEQRRKAKQGEPQ
jgi:Na+/melibiose symporter-like transporter